MTRHDIEAAAERLEDGGIRVSGQTKNIIYYVVCAVETDPHPRWKKRLSRDQFLEALPEYLSSVAAEERVERKITTFDFLHWLSGNLDKICPIEKAIP